MEGHAQKCVERYFELANKKDTATRQSLKSLLGWWSVPKGGAWIDWRMIQSVLTNYKLSWNAGIWRELVDLTFCGQWMNLLDQSPNWHDLVPDVWQDKFHTFISPVTTDNIVTWATRLSIDDWDYFMTDFAGDFEDAKIKIARGESCVSLEAEHCLHKLDV